jgi:thioredoxin reductase (NADPH)
LHDQPVALIVTDQRMPQMTGIEMLGQARTHAPGAKYLLLTAYADTEVAIEAINDIGLDYYLLKPWGSARRAAVSGHRRPAGRLAASES